MRAKLLLIGFMFCFLSIQFVQAQESERSNDIRTAVPQTSTISDDPEVLGSERLFSAWMEGQIAYRGLPGIAIGVVSDQKLVWAKGFGFADIKVKLPMTPETKFRIASNSKLFTAIAIMQLREQGKLGLDDPVVKYLPWFTPKPAGDDDGPITIEQLLSHSSGLQREASDHWSSLQFPTSEELQRLLSDRQATFAPSVRWKYSNLGFAIAGDVVEKVSGQKWADYVTQNIFKPLGMNDSSVDKNVAGLAVPYGRRMPDGSRAIFPFVDAKGMGSATGVTSDVNDLAKFISAQFRRGPRGGAQIVSGGSWREMLRVRSVEENWTTGSGLGFDMRRVKDKTYIGHKGGYFGNTTQTLIQLDDKVGVIVLTNTNDSDPSDIAQQLMATVGQAVAKAAKEKTVQVEWDASWERYAGLYRGYWGDSKFVLGDSQVVLLNKKLVIITPNGQNLDNPVSLEPLGNGKFRFMATTGGDVAGEVVRFEEVKDKPMRMYTGDSWLDRVQ
ncbi:serine hydrolase domain-containing protein [Solimicrobium silvestre]|uniref:Beta-lactamase n=1 Tax=Solimicrobium silvestre TaxID=2099400 RepID=A0A2S9GW89_9BURK|nr:serine hydrolase domain-containing protein [Solimicrobium silvestre]PRC91983.1 Beta-lactamase [Solimicrobium silvestre]